MSHVVGRVVVPRLLPALDPGSIVDRQVDIRCHHALSYVLRLADRRVSHYVLLTIDRRPLPGADPRLTLIHSFLGLRHHVALRLLLGRVPLLGWVLLLIHHVVELLTLLKILLGHQGVEIGLLLILGGLRELVAHDVLLIEVHMMAYSAVVHQLRDRLTLVSSSHGFRVGVLGELDVAPALRGVSTRLLVSYGCLL